MLGSAISQQHTKRVAVLQTLVSSRRRLPQEAVFSLGQGQSQTWLGVPQVAGAPRCYFSVVWLSHLTCVSLVSHL